jgi:hypothetical protein
VGCGYLRTGDNRAHLIGDGAGESGVGGLLADCCDGQTQNYENQNSYTRHLLPFT